MERVRAKLYALGLSHPAHAVRAMLQRKGIEHDVVNLMPGMHPPLLRLVGFRGYTVPALKLDGRRIQGSLEIARALEELRPEPPLYPSDPDARRAVEEAERWGEAELQELVRRLFRWSTAHSQELRRWMGAELVGVPAPGLLGRLNAPVARAFARASGADEARVRADLAALPSLLDRVDALIAEGAIGGEEPNAADFQIASSVRVLAAFPELRPLVASRPAGQLALRLFPRYPDPVPAPMPAGAVAAPPVPAG